MKNGLRVKELKPETTLTILNEVIIIFWMGYIRSFNTMYKWALNKGTVHSTSEQARLC